MGMGIIARDSLGNVWGSMCSYMKYLTDPATVEAYAARWGVEFCRDMGFQSFILEGDAQVRQSKQVEKVDQGNYSSLIEDIYPAKLSSFQSWRVNFACQKRK